MVYPTKKGLSPFLRDNCANRAANTWMNLLKPLHQEAGKLVFLGFQKLLAETKIDAFGQLLLLTQANEAEAYLLICVVGRIHHLSG